MGGEKAGLRFSSVSSNFSDALPSVIVFFKHINASIQLPLFIAP